MFNFRSQPGMTRTKAMVTGRNSPNELCRKAKIFEPAAHAPRGYRGPRGETGRKADAGNPHGQFDERGRETGRLAKRSAVAPFLGSTPAPPLHRSKLAVLMTAWRARVSVSIRGGERDLMVYLLGARWKSR